MRWGRHSKKSYDPVLQEPMIRVSICTGEQCAGFRSRETGHFTEIQLITCAKDLEQFREDYGIDSRSPIKTFY